MGKTKAEERHVLQKAVGDQRERGREDPEHSGRQGRPQDPERILDVLREITDHGPRQTQTISVGSPPGGHFLVTVKMRTKTITAATYDNGKDDSMHNQELGEKRDTGLAASALRVGSCAATQGLVEKRAIDITRVPHFPPLGPRTRT